MPLDGAEQQRRVDEGQAGAGCVALAQCAQVVHHGLFVVGVVVVPVDHLDQRDEFVEEQRGGVQVDLRGFDDQVVREGAVVVAEAFALGDFEEHAPGHLRNVENGLAGFFVLRENLVDADVHLDLVGEGVEDAAFAVVPRADEEVV